MNLPTAFQVKRMIDLLKGLSNEEVDTLLDSGLPDDLFSMKDPSVIDRYEFQKLCGVVIPRLEEIFHLRIDGVVRHFALVLVPCKSFYETRAAIIKAGNLIPEEECLRQFKKKFRTHDKGYPICLAIPVDEVCESSLHQKFPVLYPAKSFSKELIWEERLYTSEAWQKPNLSISNCRWLVEVVDDKSKQLGKMKWREISLPHAYWRYRKTGKDFPNGVVPDGFVEMGSKVYLSSDPEFFLLERIKQPFVQFRTETKGEGFFLIDEDLCKELEK